MCMSDKGEKHEPDVKSEGGKDGKGIRKEQRKGRVGWVGRKWRERMREEQKEERKWRRERKRSEKKTWKESEGEKE